MSKFLIFWQKFCFYVMDKSLFFSVFDETMFFFRFLTKTFFLRFWRKFFFAKLFFLAKTSFGELHLEKIHLANFIRRNFIWHRLATPIHSLALPGPTLATPVALIFSNGWTKTQTNAHSIMLNYIIDILLNLWKWCTKYEI